MKRLTFKDGNGRNTILINGQEHHGQIADRLAAFEEMMGRWAFRKIEDIDTLCRRVNKLGGTDEMADYQKAKAEGRLLVLPCSLWDTVYLPATDDWGEILSYEVVEMGIDRDGPYFVINDEDHDHTPMEELGKSVFMTRGQAAAAIKRVGA